MITEEEEEASQNLPFFKQKSPYFCETGLLFLKIDQNVEDQKNLTKKTS